MSKDENDTYEWKPAVPKAATPEPAPTGHGDMVIFEVTDDLVARAKMGIQKYGTPLRANNGRDALNDAYQEALDLVMYLKQAIMERDAFAEQSKINFAMSDFPKAENFVCGCSECDGDECVRDYIANISKHHG